MAMSLRERILTVYSGGVPDAVPYTLNLSLWFYHGNRLPWDLSVPYEVPERELIDCHRRFGCGFYVANLASFYSVSLPEGVSAATVKRTGKNGAAEIAWQVKTPLGKIERRRVWNESTYAWGVSRWGVRTEQDLAVLAHAMSGRRFASKWENYRAWVDEVGQLGVVYISPGYSAMGHLLHYWMGVEGVAYATADFPDALRRAVGQINLAFWRRRLAPSVLTFCRAECHFTGVSVKSLIASPYCGGWSRQNRRMFSPSVRVSVTGLDSRHCPRVKGISMMVLDAASFTATLSR